MNTFIRLFGRFLAISALVAAVSAQADAQVVRVDPLLVAEPDSTVVTVGEYQTINALLPDSTVVAVEESGAINVLLPDSTIVAVQSVVADRDDVAYDDTLAIIRRNPVSIYELPYSWELSNPDWARLRLNTAVLGTAFLTTLFVLQMLPEDATDWNRAEYQHTPFWERWYDNVFKKGPHVDGDLAIFNYVLHPYAGASYFMGARSCGFGFAESLVYSAFISTVFWEFGIEACMERPSLQDIVITPVVGSFIGEGFYRIKRHIVDHDYHLWGSWFFGHMVAFVVDPINEVIGLFAGNPARRIGHVTSQPLLIPEPDGSTAVGLSVRAAF